MTTGLWAVLGTVLNVGRLANMHITDQDDTDVEVTCSSSTRYENVKNYVNVM